VAELFGEGGEGSQMNELALFAGAGGGILGSKLLGHRIIGYVENNEYCQRVLAQRIKDGILDDAPIFGDIRVFNSEGYAASYTGMVDVVSGGFPCQPFSSASHGQRVADDMWPEMRRTVAIVQPRFVFAENVQREPIEAAATDLRAMGYDPKAVSLSAADMGADHIRERFWLLAYADDQGELLRRVDAKMGCLPELQSRVWQVPPGNGGMVDGMAARLDRFKATGNGQIPIVAATAFRILSGILQKPERGKR
jgi:DNA (cytosine-5)-methyltransferase 1